MNKIGIFCSACEQISSRYFECTRELGAWMAAEGKTLVYGGADMGLMECIAHTVKEHGGKVMGVVPTKLEEKGRVSDLLDVTFHTVNLSDRKDVILRESDILVALPGGVGTLDEVFHVVAAATIGYHTKRVVLYNIDGFWDSMLAMLQQMETKGFIRRPLNQFLNVATTLDELKDLLK
ncbi:MAG: TIGR00730 family Rossman fold protein [Bacteroidaceae bacterium]|nr:TIGR00730 family Rossman fold protein [Bacteroidaceae bacterium]